MRWFRWRIATLMSIVGLAAVAAAAHEMRLRSQAYRRRADYHIAASQQLLRDNKDILCGYARSLLSAAQLRGGNGSGMPKRASLRKLRSITFICTQSGGPAR